MNFVDILGVSKDTLTFYLDDDVLGSWMSCHSPRLHSDWLLLITFLITSPNKH